MNKLLAGAVLVLASVPAVHAQEVTGAGIAAQPAAMSDFSTISEVRLASVRDAGDLAAFNAIALLATHPWSAQPSIIWI